MTLRSLRVTDGRKARSQALLSADTSIRCKKTNRCARHAPDGGAGVGAVAVEQIGPQPGEGTLEQAVQPALQQRDLPPKAGGGQFVAAVIEMDRRAEQSLQLARPAQVRAPIHTAPAVGAGVKPCKARI